MSRSRASERSLVRSFAVQKPAPPRFRTGLRQQEEKDFHAPHGFAQGPAYCEAPYCFLSESCPELPNLGHTGSASTSNLPRYSSSSQTIQERLARRAAINDRTSQEGNKLASFRSKQKVIITRQIKLEKIESVQRLRQTDKVRVQRWTEKTKDNPFAVDLWKEDDKLYEAHQKNNKLSQQRQQRETAAVMENRARKLAKACGEVDELDLLRKEKKKLIESQKELKARLDLEKVNKRLAFAQKQQDEFQEHLDNQARKRGTFLRAHSDFFTDTYESLEPEKEEEEDDEELQEFQAHARKSLRASVFAADLQQDRSEDDDVKERAQEALERALLGATEEEEEDEMKERAQEALERALLGATEEEEEEDEMKARAQEALERTLLGETLDDDEAEDQVDRRELEAESERPEPDTAADAESGESDGAAESAATPAESEPAHGEAMESSAEASADAPVGSASERGVSPAAASRPTTSSSRGGKAVNFAPDGGEQPRSAAPAVAASSTPTDAQAAERPFSPPADASSRPGTSSSRGSPSAKTGLKKGFSRSTSRMFE